MFHQIITLEHQEGYPTQDFHAALLTDSGYGIGCIDGKWRPASNTRIIAGVLEEVSYSPCGEL